MNRITQKNPSRNQRDAVLVGFVLLQIVLITIAVQTRDVIVIDTSGLKKYPEGYLQWYMYEYLSIAGKTFWVRRVNVLKTILSFLLFLAIAIVSDLSHRRGELSSKELLLCIGLNAAAFALVRIGLSVLFEHYYLYWNLLLPEILCLALFELSEIANKNRCKTDKGKGELL